MSSVIVLQKFNNQKLMLSLPLLFLIVVSAPCCKRVTAITLCPLN